jgi:hypothetical protein
MITLKWLPSWSAYSVRVRGQVVGMVRCAMPLPFRIAITFL